MTGLLVLAGMFAVPYWAARGLWRLPVAWPVRLALFLGVATALVVLLGPGLGDVTSPGAPIILLELLAGWTLGTTGAFRRRLLLLRQVSRG